MTGIGIYPRSKGWGHEMTEKGWMHGADMSVLLVRAGHATLGDSSPSIKCHVRLSPLQASWAALYRF